MILCYKFKNEKKNSIFYDSTEDFTAKMSWRWIKFEFNTKNSETDEVHGFVARKCLFGKKINYLIPEFDISTYNSVY